MVFTIEHTFFIAAVSVTILKVLASRLASGDVLVFLDSHCEVTEGWLPPLLAPIAEDEKRYAECFDSKFDRE